MPAPDHGCGAAQRRPHATDATPSPTESKEHSTRRVSHTPLILVAYTALDAPSDMLRPPRPVVVVALTLHPSGVSRPHPERMIGIGRRRTPSPAIVFRLLRSREQPRRP